MRNAAFDEVDPQFIQKITSSKGSSKTSRSRSFQLSSSSASGSPSGRRGRLQKAETISEDRLESARQAAGLEDKIVASLETRVNFLKDDNMSQPSSDDEKPPPAAVSAPPTAAAAAAPQPTIQVPSACQLHRFFVCTLFFRFSVVQKCVHTYMYIAFLWACLF